MEKQLKPFLIIGGFWLALFLFVVAGYSGSFGITEITGNVINEKGSTTPIGAQALIIIILFFTNITTLFFLAREIANK